MRLACWLACLPCLSRRRRCWLLISLLVIFFWSCRVSIARLVLSTLLARDGAAA